MRQLFLFLFLLLLAINGLLAWQNWKNENTTSSAVPMLTCDGKQKKADSGSVMLPGAVVYLH